MAGLKKFIITFAILAVFSLAILNFTFGVQVLNNANTTILDEDAFEVFNTSVGANIVQVQDDITVQKNITDSEVCAEKRRGELTLTSIFTQWVRFSNFIVGFIT